MQSTKQQQILGYFIEEAKEHLDTIERGLMSLQATLADSEEMNQIFRAAHSIKGGAAMLGYDSIQRIGHHLEDAFKLLKETPNVTVDRHLEDLFLKGFDTMKALVEALQGPYGLRPEDGDKMVRESEPVFRSLGSYLQKTLRSSTPLTLKTTSVKTVASPSGAAVEQVNTVLKLMLQLFKQGDSPKGRQQLSALCARLAHLAKDTPIWVALLQNVHRAIANPAASYTVLAPLVIKEVKQSSDLLLTGRAREILPSKALQQLAGIKKTSPTVTLPVSAPVAISPLPTTSALSRAKLPGAGTKTNTPPETIGKVRQIVLPCDPRSAARGLLEHFNKAELIQIAEFLMKAIQ